jgi:DNA-binding MarR family transcriptional regulator
MADHPLRLDDFIPYRLSFSAKLVSDAIARVYEADFGLTVPEWRVIAWLGEQGSMTQQDICARTRMDKVSISRAAVSLLARGLLDRSAHPTDRRSRLLSLSEAGRNLHAGIAPRALALEGRLLASLEAAQVDVLMGMLRQIDAAAIALTDQRSDP